MNIVLKEALNIALVHKSRIDEAFERIKHFFPISYEKLAELQFEDLAYFEVYINRLAKLQDLIGTKIFIGLLEEVEEEAEIDKMTFIDKLNKLEKLEIIDSAEEWKEMRKLRNRISHEYPDMPDLTAKLLNEMHDMMPRLLNYLEKIINFTRERL